MNRPAHTPHDVAASAVIVATPCTYRGVVVRETAGAAAVVRIRDHASAASGKRITTINLPANGMWGETVPDGVRAESGLYWEVVSGTVEGTVRIG